MDVFAYLDDLTAVTEESKAEEVIEIVTRAMRLVGLKSKPSKMTVWTQSGEAPPGAQAARAWHAQEHHDGYVLLGQPLHCGEEEQGRPAIPMGSEAYITAWLNERKEKMRCQVEMLCRCAAQAPPDIASRQAAYQVLRQCILPGQAHPA